MTKPILYVLIGNTGTGKTEVLQALQAAGQNCVNLETMAGHSGSYFGKFLYGSEKISQHQFSSRIKTLVDKAGPTQHIFCEWKGSHIGHITLPDAFLKAQKTAKKILLIRDDDLRIRHLSKQYEHIPRKYLYEGLFTLENKMSAGNFEKCLESLDNFDFPSFVKYILPYFDNAATYNNPDNIIFSVNTNQTEMAVKEILIRLGLKSEKNNSLKM